MKVLTLTQAPTYPLDLAAQVPTDLLCLTYDERHEGCLWLPKSTWTQGRNALLAAADLEKYDYIIFCDDDVQFRRGSWELFIDLLEKKRPEVAVPCFEEYEQKEHVIWFDAILNAYRTDTVLKYLPYNGMLDNESWHYSQLLVYDRVLTFLPKGVRQFLECEVVNPLHRPYPRESDFAGVIDKYFVSKEKNTCWRRGVVS